MTTLPCPVAESCESCGTPDGLTAVGADTPIGVLCLTVCGRCQDDQRAPRLTVPAAVHRVLDHCEHTGRTLDEPGSPA